MKGESTLATGIISTSTYRPYEKIEYKWIWINQNFFLQSRDEYAAKVCPDCEGYNCADDEVCEMVEDDSGKKVPQCAEKQTGCDVDRFIH